MEMAGRVSLILIGDRRFGGDVLAGHAGEDDGFPRRVRETGFVPMRNGEAGVGVFGGIDAVEDDRA